MKSKLVKTFLSKRPYGGSFLVALTSLLILLFFFQVDSKQFSANGHQVFTQKEYWRAFTTSLLHADLTHFAHNAFFFTGLAALLHSYFGFYVFPLLSIFAGGLINIIVLQYYPPDVTLVGISGVIYFMASFWLTLYVLIEKRQSILVRLIHSIAVSLIFLFPEAFSPRTSYLAHGFGFLFGLPLGILYYAFYKEKILAAEEWTSIETDDDELIDVSPMEESSSHPEKLEDGGPSGPFSDSSRYQ